MEKTVWARFRVKDTTGSHIHYDGTRGQAGVYYNLLVKQSYQPLFGKRGKSESYHANSYHVMAWTVDGTPLPNPKTGTLLDLGTLVLPEGMNALEELTVGEPLIIVKDGNPADLNGSAYAGGLSKLPITWYPSRATIIAGKNYSKRKKLQATFRK